MLVPLAVVCTAMWAYWLRMRHVLLEALHAVEATPSDARLSHGLPGLDGDAGASPRGLVAVDVENAAFVKSVTRDLRVLRALTAAAPLLGLLGTVVGMTETFDAVSMGGGLGARMAAGLSRALITTQVGLVVAIPGVFGVMRLERMRRHLEGALARRRLHRLQRL